MQRPSFPVSESSAGFLLLDAGMNPIFVNTVAAQILIYPHSIEEHPDLLSSKISSTLVNTQSWDSPALVNRFQSGRRMYLCRAFQVNSAADKDPHAALAVILERDSGRSMPLADLAERFHLTIREKEVIQCLMQGLTSKEIAGRMAISPNTVKAFLRLIMVKMGVSTRSGIVGKAYRVDSVPELQDLQRNQRNLPPPSLPQLDPSPSS
jgi:DNA-binding CsgD family transcriptional regulator